MLLNLRTSVAHSTSLTVCTCCSSQRVCDSFHLPGQLAADNLNMTKMSQSWSDYCNLCCVLSSKCVGINSYVHAPETTWYGGSKGTYLTLWDLKPDGTSWNNVLLGATINSSCIPVSEHVAFTHGGCSFNQSPAGKICSAYFVDWQIGRNNLVWLFLLVKPKKSISLCYCSVQVDTLNTLKVH